MNENTILKVVSCTYCPFCDLSAVADGECTMSGTAFPQNYDSDWEHLPDCPLRGGGTVTVRSEKEI